jgi:hypothetical protein
MSGYANIALSLIGVCCLAGAGVSVGSGVAMMYSQMAQEEQQKSTGAVAHSVVEPKLSLASSRGFAASGAARQ